MQSTQLTLRDVLAKSTQFLEQKRVDSPRLSAELVAAHALGMNRLDLFLDPDKPLQEAELAKIRPFLARRAAGEPMAYILGQREFYGLDFFVCRDVLIPRPDTELGIDLVRKVFSKEQPFCFADVGTGSGALAITLLKHFPNARGLATDICPKALAVARKNAEHHHVTDRVLMARGDLLQHATVDSLDMIIANLPYIGEEEVATLSREVAGFEPLLALVGGSRGDELFGPLLADAMKTLRAGGHLLLEVGVSQAQSIMDQIRQSSGNWSSIATHADYTGRNRFVQAVWS